MLNIYNTLTREKEKFKPLRQEIVKVYFCGPTVYNYAHIWNLRAYVFEDLVIRTLRFLWFKASVVMNITDIDDKTIRDSQKAGETLKDFTEKYTKIFLDDIEKIGIKKADKIIPISTLIDEMVEMTNTLIKKWYAYIWEDQSIYYDISKFKDYGKLAHLDFKWMKSSVRIDNDEYEKENAADFVLWKAWKPTDWENYREKEFIINNVIANDCEAIQRTWNNIVNGLLRISQWQTESQESQPTMTTIKWRPGWHIECSACNLAHFWPEIDIHMWWVDLIFPHHQNEIAQSEAVTWKKFAKYWIHSWHLMVDGKKMSKSLGNFHTLRDIEKKYEWKVSPSVLFRSFRLAFINGKYRDNIDFSFIKLEQNFNSIERIDETIKKLYLTKKSLVSEKNLTTQKSWVLKVKWIRREFRDSMQVFVTDYIEKLEDDFDFVEALAVFYNFVTFVNKEITNISLEEYNAIIDMFKTFDEVFWIIDFTDNTEIEIPENVLEKLYQRNEAKKDKDFTKADKIRDEIDALWYKIVDDRSGSRVERK
jgi:cysteinyl-tRNA synthetase